MVITCKLIWHYYYAPCCDMSKQEEGGVLRTVWPDVGVSFYFICFI